MVDFEMTEDARKPGPLTRAEASACVRQALERLRAAGRTV
jgi:hypothetical protein